MHHKELLVNKDSEYAICTVVSSLDYSDFLDINAEDMTTIAEDLKSTFMNIKKIKVSANTIDNLQAPKHAKLIMEDGNDYVGSFHIHIDTSNIMSGATHSSKSQTLYSHKAIPSAEKYKKQLHILKKKKKIDIQKSKSTNSRNHNFLDSVRRSISNKIFRGK